MCVRCVLDVCDLNYVLRLNDVFGYVNTFLKKVFEIGKFAHGFGVIYNDEK